MSQDLFTAGGVQGPQPLAERLRPRTVAEFFAPQAWHQQVAPLFFAAGRGQLPNLVLWGPPGTGKTTFARLLGQEARIDFVSANAADFSVKEMRELGRRGHSQKLTGLKQVVLFIDEIHRLSKSQQDVLLPFIENGDLVLIGATTENPSHSLNSALISRSRVLAFARHTPDQLRQVLERAAQMEGVLLAEIFRAEAVSRLMDWANGDARQLLGAFEWVIGLHQLAPEREKFDWPLSAVALATVLSDKALAYDRKGDEHYNTISAFIKSIRGSDADAGLYYLARLLEGGEDPLFVARRLVILASEDIGNADPRAISVAIAGLQAVQAIGLPEAAISLAQVTTYLAAAPKSNRSYLGLKKAQSVVKETGNLPIPRSLWSTGGEGYRYSHDYPRGWVDQRYLPDGVPDVAFYEPSEHGFEKNIKAYRLWLRGQ